MSSNNTTIVVVLSLIIFVNQLTIITIAFGSGLIILMLISCYVSGAVHTRVEVRRMYSEMSGLVEQPWLQLMCCAICLPHDRNFR